MSSPDLDYEKGICRNCVSVCDWICSHWSTVTWPSLVPCPVVLLLLAAGLGMTARVKRLELQLIFRSYFQSRKCNTGLAASLACRCTVLPVSVTHTHTHTQIKPIMQVSLCECASWLYSCSPTRDVASPLMLSCKSSTFSHSAINTHNTTCTATSPIAFVCIECASFRLIKPRCVTLFPHIHLLFPHPH